MKQVILILLAINIIISCSNSQTQEVKKYSVEQFFKNTLIGGGYFSPDESKLLVQSNETGIVNVFALSIADAKSTQLTKSTEDAFWGIDYVPDGNGFFYQADKGGDENGHIYWVDGKNTTIDVTPFEGAKSSFSDWSRDGKSFFFISNKRNPKFFDLYEKDVANLNDPKKFKQIYKNETGMWIEEISPNKRYLVLNKAITTSDNELYLLDLKKKKMKHITKHTGTAQYESQYFDNANENLFLLTNENCEYKYLAKHHIQSGKTEKVYETNWDIMYAYNSYNEKYRVIKINEDAKAAIQIIDLSTNKKLDLPEIKGGSISAVNISKSEKLFRLTVSSSTSSNNLFVYNIETKKLKQLTHTLNPEIDENDLVKAEVIRYKSYDGLEIPAIFYKPHNASASNKVPALVDVHGGPGGQSRLNYDAYCQYLANQGYAILAVNNRGSSGYGKTFYQMDDQKHGDVDLKDCISAKDFLSNTGIIDTNCIGISGGSYGGYMVIAALTFTPQEFAVGVDFFGPVNWLRTIKSIPPHWESMRKALYKEMGNPFSSDSVRIYNMSPLFHAKNIVKPVIVLQGANDPRALQIESDEIVAAIKANDVPVEYVLFEDEGHGFMKNENRIEGYKKVKAFLDKYLTKNY